VTYTCTRCGCKHDGEPARGWKIRRGQDPAQIMVCNVCFIAAIEHMADEADQVLGPEDDQ